MGIKATKASMPRSSPVTPRPSLPDATPRTRAKMKVTDIVPVATPPESKAMATNDGWQKTDNSSASKYPGPIK